MRRRKRRSFQARTELTVVKFPNIGYRTIEGSRSSNISNPEANHKLEPTREAEPRASDRAGEKENLKNLEAPKNEAKNTSRPKKE